VPNISRGGISVLKCVNSKAIEMEIYRTEVCILAGAVKYCFHHCVQTGSGVHPASYSVGTGGSVTRGKAAGT